MIKREFEVYSYEEAKAAAEAEGLTVNKNKTMAWKNAGCPVGDVSLKKFAEEQLKKEKLEGVPGMGFIIVASNGTKDSRERPYKLENVHTEGKIEKERTYEVRRTDNDELILSLSGRGATKDRAIKEAKAVMHEVKADLYIRIVYCVKDGKDVIARVSYAPSVNAEKGRYIFVGNDPSTF